MIPVPWFSDTLLPKDEWNPNFQTFKIISYLNEALPQDSISLINAINIPGFNTHQAENERLKA